MKKTFTKVLGGVVFASMLLTACGGGNPAKNNTKFKYQNTFRKKKKSRGRFGFVVKRSSRTHTDTRTVHNV